MASDIERWRSLGSASDLVGDQKLLFVFVNDDGNSPWTRELRTPVEEKIERCLRWLEGEAQRRGVQLHFQHVCVPSGGPVACDAQCHIDEGDYCAGPHHSTWQNRVVARLAGSGSVSSRWDDLFRVYGLPLDGAEGSAVFFCVRRSVPSVAFQFREGENSEFEKERGIIYDNGGDTGQIYLASQIAHEILHLYGAVDLAPHKAPDRLKEYASQYSGDLMHTPTRHALDGYHIGDLTAYLVGWSQTKPELPAQVTS